MKIGSYNDLIKLSARIDSEVDRYSEVKGQIHVFPHKDYIVNNREDLDRVVRRIQVFSSPYASVEGMISFNVDKIETFDFDREKT